MCIAKSLPSSADPPLKLTKTPILLPCRYVDTSPEFADTDALRTEMFSPSFITSSWRACSSVLPEANFSPMSATTSVTPLAPASSATLEAKPKKLASLPTKSVSQLTSTSAPVLPSFDIHVATVPSAAMRPATFEALLPLLILSKSSAF